MIEVRAASLAAKTAEWIEADGLGGFASGTVPGVRTRRYHALLLTARRPPTDRFVLVNGFDAWVDTPGGSFAISSQAYARDTVSPDGATRIAAFARDPWPRWTFQLPDGSRVEQQIFVPHGTSAVALLWRLTGATQPAMLRVRPFFSGRDYHALHHENGAFRFAPERRDGRLVWRPYDGVPAVIAHGNGDYHHAPLWYRDFRYDEELARGLDGREDLAAPGEFRFDLGAGEAALLFAAEGHDAVIGAAGETAADAAARLQRSERTRRASFASPLDRAADAYVVQRGGGCTVIAGYPWFTDWGRDTLIALRGLCLATGRLDVARAILLEWSASVSEGMLPNRFPDHGEMPEFNAVDASLWFVVAASEWIAAAERAAFPVALEESWRIESAIDAILAGYEKGTRFGIRADADGLLAAGAPGVQLTWMDAKVGDWVVTPRSGKPVEVQALWINALRLAGGTRAAAAERARAAFRARFWNAGTGCLFDVVDADHVPGRDDPSVRPNQLFAVGGLPDTLVDSASARAIVDTVERELLTPAGIRTLAPHDAAYRGRYAGDPAQRDAAYHQGTAWPWLLGAFVDAWLRVHGDDAGTRREARKRFLVPLQAHFAAYGLDHVGEIADGDAPHAPRGCPFQAWSVGELIRALKRTAPDATA